MTLPTIHDNGTSARMLAASAEAAYDALQAAFDLLRQTAPNGRDYYLQPAGALEKAEVEHRARLAKVHEVMEDMERLIYHCDEEGA